MGHGPALNVGAQIFPEGAGPWTWDQGVLAPSDAASVLFVGAKQNPANKTITVELNYHDLSLRGHQTGITLDFAGKDPDSYKRRGFVRNVVFLREDTTQQNEPANDPAEHRIFRSDPTQADPGVIVTR